ncbi:MAG TPA: efflux RND transporter permease subunit [Candidatus Saccharimonadales bacterium]|nr:efflux RND transporter permease subunit [Candidatus Saccharimonadales bacterium]
MKNKTKELKPLQKLTLYFFNHTRQTALLWLIITLFGAFCYSTLLNREGFPGIETPYAMGKGAYLVNDPARVDTQVASPIDAYLMKQPDIKTVQSHSQGNFYSIIVSYKDNTNAAARSKQLHDEIISKGIIPGQATFELDAYKFGFSNRGDDLIVSFYSTAPVSTKQLANKAEKAVEYLKSKNMPLVNDLYLINPLKTAMNPSTGREETAQQLFDRYGERTDGENNFYNSVTIGFSAKKGADNLKLDSEVQSAINEMESQPEFSSYQGAISASYAPQIRAQISELQRVLLEGLLAVLIISSLVIAVRASLLTVISMVSVIAIVNGFLYLIGYTLNTITLFSLILGLSLIIDDTIIMVEALDAQRRRHKKSSDAVSIATGKVSRAMVAATLTAALSFSPLIFVGGILGKFIREIPITIISALFISLIVAFIFIPLFAKLLLLTRTHIAKSESRTFKLENKIAEFIARPMLAARHSTKKLASLGLLAILVGFIFIGAGVYLFTRNTLNIFPASKDSNELRVTLNFPSGTSVKQAEAIADKADRIVSTQTGQDFAEASYYGEADVRTATLYVRLIDYNDRAATSPELISRLNKSFEGFSGAQVDIGQIDPGPPPADFSVHIDSGKNRAGALKLRGDIEAYLKSAKLKRIDGSIARIKSVKTGNSDVYSRVDNKQYVEVTASFVDNDTTTLVNLARASVQKHFPSSKVASYGLAKDGLKFDFGQESDNQKSFKTLAYAFPVVLLAIYILLAIQFRSLLQPLLIFMAIPFSLFGVTLGLYLTNNAFSFFALLGFFALIGLSIKNTILLTDYANQSRRRGSGPVDAIHEALAERFRPLAATSLTAVVSLIPLAVTSPFWQGLTVVLIFGLLSSTLLVVGVFPYYYLGGEYLRQKFHRRKA